MNVLSLFKEIRCFIFDVDGVLTDGSLLLLENGLQARRMNIKDGYALQLAVKKGYAVRVISGSNSPEVTERLRKLGITDVHMGVLDKSRMVEEYLASQGFRKEEVLFMGDDMPDLPVMGRVGLAACPADAVQEIKEAAHYISPFTGGAGCVRDVIEKTMKLRGHWQHREDVASS